MTKKIKLILSILFLSFLVISCASNQHAALGAQKAVLSKENDRMFWKISSTDKEGKPSYIYMQGTVHLGNDRIFPIGENVLYQFDNADRVYAEISSEDILKRYFIPNYSVAVENAKIVYQMRFAEHIKKFGKDSKPHIWEWNSSTSVFRLVDALKLTIK